VTRDRRRLLVAVPTLALMILLTASFMTRGAMEHLPFLNGRAGNMTENGSMVDQRPWQIAQAVAPLAVTAEEKAFAQEAQRLADHEVDQAFAMALRQASMQTRVLTGRAFELQKKVLALEATAKEDQTRVDTLTSAAKNNSSIPETEGDELDVAKAQLGLDKDELADAVDDLARESGDNRSKIQQELTAREAAMKKYDAQTDEGAQVAVLSAARYGTLYGRVKAWLSQRSRSELLAQAQRQAEADGASLAAQHGQMESKASSQEDATAKTADVGAARVKLLQSMATRRTVLSLLDDRIEGQQQLAAVYNRWQAQVRLQHQIILHLLLESFALICGIVLLTVLSVLLARVGVDRMWKDKRQAQTLRTVFDLSIQAAGLLLVLLVIFGAPSQTPTIVGLATAGLTVVFQDFILAFFGWFVLMGRSGIRVCDWVEINGVGGEVAEIGLFRTSLLETGNWTANGHPTGRRVTFLNSFAIRGQYFNFSTTGQWMWDEIKVTIPAGESSYALIEEIHQAAFAATKEDVAAAEEEWKSVTRQHGLSQFAAAPSVNLRPAAGGIDLVVRYVTSAGGRLETRNRLFQTVLDLMREGDKLTVARPPSELTLR